MTYKQKLDQLREEFAIKSDKYLLADKELSEDKGFVGGNLVGKFAKAKRDFEIVGNEYSNFLAYAVKNKAKLQDDFINEVTQND